MANLRLRIELYKGRKGIPLDKLEQVVHEIRGFLTLFAEDLQVQRPALWSGVNFKNGSLIYTAEHQGEVSEGLLASFGKGIVDLAKNARPAYVRPVTISQFHNIVEPIAADDKVRLGVFPADGKKLKWLSISRETLMLPVGVELNERQSIGSVQGVIHSLFKEVKDPYFNLRDLFTGQLVKCLYDPKEEYEAIVEALRIPDRIVHVHGRITETCDQGKRISLVEVDRILLADPFTFEDVEKFLSGKPH